MQINIVVDENNIITSWTSYPLSKKKPILEIDDPYSIKLGFDKYVGGKLIKDEETYNKYRERENKLIRIDELKKNLSSTDYKLFKYLEGELSEEEYLSIKTLRQSWRNEINKLEEETR